VELVLIIPTFYLTNDLCVINQSVCIHVRVYPQPQAQALYSMKGLLNSRVTLSF